MQYTWLLLFWKPGLKLKRQKFKSASFQTFLTSKYIKIVKPLFFVNRAKQNCINAFCSMLQKSGHLFQHSFTDWNEIFTFLENKILKQKPKKRKTINCKIYVNQFFFSPPYWLFANVLCFCEDVLHPSPCHVIDAAANCAQRVSAAKCR